MKGSFHSSAIALLKVLLPLAALGLLSTVFLLARTMDESPELTFFDSEAEIPDYDSVTRPYYTGSTPEGHAIGITALYAAPMADDPNGVLARTLEASIQLVDGSKIDIAAENAAVNEPQDLLELSGDVIIKSSSGYVVRSEILRSALRSINADAPGQIEATGPIGEITAGAFQIRDHGEGDGVQLFFTDGVKLIYRPATPMENTPETSGTATESE